MLKSLEATLKDIEKVTIIGHDNIDVDSFLSGILLSRLLTFIGVKNKFVILEEVKQGETFCLVKDLLGIDMKLYQSTIEDSSRVLFLEDHYETSHLGNVVACLDHHKTEKDIQYPFYYTRQSCSTSYLVYELMCQAGYFLSKEDAKMIVASMLVDTVSFRSTKTVSSEVEVAKDLSRRFGLDFNKLERLCLCLTPIESLTTDEIIQNGVKTYCYNGYKVRSSYVQVFEIPNEQTVQLWLDCMQKVVKSTNLDRWVFIIFECNYGKTIEFHISSNSIEKIETPQLLSRGTNIMPLVESFYNSLP